MIGGMIESIRGCMKEEVRMDIISNNLANSNVFGFKKSRISFQKMLDEAANDINERETLLGDSDLMLIDIRTDLGQGDIRATGNDLDVAIAGDGFFKIDTPYGIRYTRKGNFQLDAQGNLTTQDGSYVLGKNGPITINGTEIQIDKLGFIYVDGNPGDQLDIVDFEDPENVVNDGFSRLKHLLDNPPESDISPDTSIKQGYVELSNVNAAEEMVNMIHCMRAFESYQKAIKVLDDCDNRAINQVGKLR
jgi:flagellar basal-body rod protein FlgF